MRAKKDPFGQKKPTRVTHPLYLFAITAYSYKSSEWKESGIGIDVEFSGRFYVRKNYWDIRGGIDVATITAVKTSDHYPIEVRFNDNKKASCSGTNLWMIWKMECYDSCPNKARNERIEVTTCWGNWRIRFSGTLTYRKFYSTTTSNSSQLFSDLTHQLPRIRPFHSIRGSWEDASFISIFSKDLV